MDELEELIAETNTGRQLRVAGARR